MAEVEKLVHKTEETWSPLQDMGEKSPPLQDTENSSSLQDMENSSPLQDTENSSPLQDTENSSPLQDTENSSPLQDSDAELNKLIKSITDFEEESLKLIDAITAEKENSSKKYDATMKADKMSHLLSVGAGGGNKHHENDVQEENVKMNTGGENGEEEKLTDHKSSATGGENGRKTTITMKDAKDAIDAVMQVVSDFTGPPPNKTHIEEEFGVELRVKSKSSINSDMNVLMQELDNLLLLTGEALNARDLDGQTTAKKSNPPQTQPPTPVVTATTYTHTQGTHIHIHIPNTHTHTPNHESQKLTQPHKYIPNPVPKPPRAYDPSYRPTVLSESATGKPEKGGRDSAFLIDLKNKIAVDAMKRAKKEESKHVEAVDTHPSGTSPQNLAGKGGNDEGVQREKTEDEWKRGQAFAIANALKNRKKSVQQ